jgi:hypothetical protein
MSLRGAHYTHRYVVGSGARRAPLSAPGFSRMIERAATAASPGIKPHAHMLRHACGPQRKQERDRRGVVSGRVSETPLRHGGARVGHLA